MGRLRELQTLRGHTDRVWYVCWHPAGKVLATCSGDKTVRIWGLQYSNRTDTASTNTSEELHEELTDANKQTGKVDAASTTSPKTNDSSKNILLSEDVQWVCKFTLTEGHSGAVRALCWSPDGRYLATCGFDGIVNVWQLSEGDFECIASLEGHENEVKSIAWSISGQYLATAGRDKTVWIWEATEDRIDDDNDTAPSTDIDFECESVMHSHTQDVKKVIVSLKQQIKSPLQSNLKFLSEIVPLQWHPNDDILISASYDDTIKFYSKKTDDWSCYDTLYGHSSTVWSIDMHPSGQVLVSASADKTLRFWARDADAQPPAQMWKQISIVGESVAGTFADKAQQTDAEPNISPPSIHTGPIYDVKWNQYMPALIATACGDNGVRVFTCASSLQQQLDDASSSQPELSLEELKANFHDVVKLDAEQRTAHTRDCNAVAWYPSATVAMLASAGDDNLVKLWLYEPDNDHSVDNNVEKCDELKGTV